MNRMMIAATVAMAAMAPAMAQESTASAVEKEWPAYDTGNKGYLDQAEFSKWLVTLKSKSGDASDPASLQRWADGAFVKADADANSQVSKSELVAYLDSGKSR